MTDLNPTPTPDSPPTLLRAATRIGSAAAMGAFGFVVFIIRAYAASLGADNAVLVLVCDAILVVLALAILFALVPSFKYLGLLVFTLLAALFFYVNIFHGPVPDSWVEAVED
jgi:glucan phosphoethanolaminetransferase (alkaline phosphatase superfamily)